MSIFALATKAASPRIDKQTLIESSPSLYQHGTFSLMDEKIANAGKEGMKGNKGVWKGFLNVYDTKVGVSLSDPARRSTDALVAFLKTCSKEDNLKFFDKVMQSHSHRDTVEPVEKKSADTKSPEQCRG